MMTATEIIPQILLISILVWAVWITMQPTGIFHSLYEFLDQSLRRIMSEKKADFISQPIYACIVCMSFWHGLYIYWLVIARSWPDCIVTCIGAIGMNAIILKIIDRYE